MIYLVSCKGIFIGEVVINLLFKVNDNDSLLDYVNFDVLVLYVDDDLYEVVEVVIYSEKMVMLVVNVDNKLLGCLLVLLVYELC